MKISKRKHLRRCGVEKVETDTDKSIISLANIPHDILRKRQDEICEVECICMG